MQNRKDIKKRRKRKVRSEAIVILTLGALLLFLVTSMSISVVARYLQTTSADPTSNVIKPEGNIGDKEVIVIDPGHGGIDTGCNYGEIYEKDVTLKIAKYMGDYLKDNEYEIVYTRESDMMLGDYELADLENRVAVASTNQANYFVSIHLNISDIDYERIHGFEIYTNESMDASMKLGESVNKELTSLGYTESRGLRDGSILHVVYTNSIPSVLIEIGYMDDEGDRNYITSEEGMKKIGESLAKSVIATKE